MRKFLIVLALTAMAVMGAACMAMAAEGEVAAGGAGWLQPFVAISCGLAIAIAAFGGAIGQSKAIVAALKGIARNPGAAGKITTPMIIGLAMIESLVIYAFVISLILVLKL